MIWWMRYCALYTLLLMCDQCIAVNSIVVCVCVHFSVQELPFFHHCIWLWGQYSFGGHVFCAGCKWCIMVLDSHAVSVSVRFECHVNVSWWDSSPGPSHKSQASSYDGGRGQTTLSHLHSGATWKPVSVFAVLKHICISLCDCLTGLHMSVTYGYPKCVYQYGEIIQTKTNIINCNICNIRCCIITIML